MLKISLYKGTYLERKIITWLKVWVCSHNACLLLVMIQNFDKKYNISNYIKFWNLRKVYKDFSCAFLKMYIYSLYNIRDVNYLGKVH